MVFFFVQPLKDEECYGKHCHSISNQFHFIGGLSHRVKGQGMVVDEANKKFPSSYDPLDSWKLSNVPNPTSNPHNVRHIESKDSFLLAFQIMTLDE